MGSPGREVYIGKSTSASGEGRAGGACAASIIISLQVQSGDVWPHGGKGGRPG